MAFIHTYLCWFIFITSSAAELNPPTNVNITISGNNVTVTWTLPGESETFTFLMFYSSERREKVKYIKTPHSSYTITLTSCKKYRLDMLCLNSNSSSENVVTTFFVTDNIFYSSINTDINISWTTNLGQFYDVLAPSNIVIYKSIGNIVPNTDMNKYKINSKGTEQIDISVLNVSQNDSGIYQSGDSPFRPDGCCLLIITDKPKTPTIVFNKYPFVGDELEFTCASQVQRWPVWLSSSLTYTFSIDGAQQYNTLKINVTISDKGKHVYCNAMDDRRDVSNVSNVIVLDPYYGPGRPVLSPSAESVNITEGSKLGPIICSVECHPNCNYVWRHKMTGGRSFSDIGSSQSLEIYNITRVQSGKYLCRVNHPNDTSRYERKDFMVAVHFPPQTPTNFSLVSSTETSILVEWTPGYSDDHEQTFCLEYRARRTETWSLKEISHNTKQLTSLTYVLSGLQDSTLYELKMYSKNKFGRSLSTDIDIIQTRAKQEKASGLYAVIGGMAGVIAVLVIIVIILKRKKGCSSGARNNISNRSNNIDEMFSPNRTTSDMYEEIREDTSGTRNEDLHQRGGNTSTTTCEMLAMQDIPNTYGDLSSEQEQRQSESTTEQYETLGEQDKPNVYEEIKNKEGPEDREYINLQL